MKKKIIEFIIAATIFLVIIPLIRSTAKIVKEQRQQDKSAIQEMIDG
jgi:large-conductance mechanosensitive channel